MHIQIYLFYLKAELQIEEIKRTSLQRPTPQMTPMAWDEPIWDQEEKLKYLSHSPTPNLTKLEGQLGSETPFTFTINLKTK